MLSNGTPMFCAGDEFLEQQRVFRQAAGRLPQRRRHEVGKFIAEPEDRRRLEPDQRRLRRDDRRQQLDIPDREFLRRAHEAF